MAKIKQVKQDVVQNLKINTLELSYTFMAQALEEFKKTMQTGFNEVKCEIRSMREYNDKVFVKQESFVPVKMVVYGMVGAILLAVLGSLIALVIK